QGIAHRREAVAHAAAREGEEEKGPWKKTRERLEGQPRRVSQDVDESSVPHRVRDVSEVEVLGGGEARAREVGDLPGAPRGKERREERRDPRSRRPRLAGDEKRRADGREEVRRRLDAFRQRPQRDEEPRAAAHQAGRDAEREASVPDENRAADEESEERVRLAEATELEDLRHRKVRDPSGEGGERAEEDAAVRADEKRRREHAEDAGKPHGE